MYAVQQSEKEFLGWYLECNTEDLGKVKLALKAKNKYCRRTTQTLVIKNRSFKIYSPF
jgi:hypothetical protein